MATYHILQKPLARAADGKVVWGTNCGLKVSLPPRPDVKPGTTVQTPDRYGIEVIECAGCYAGVDETKSDKQITQEQQQMLDRGQQLGDVEMNDDDPFKTIAEERDEYPKGPTV